MKKITITVSTLVVVGIITTGVTYHLKHKKQHHAATIPAIPVKLSTVKMTDLPTIATANGTLTANQSTYISAKVSGYVTAINYKEGQYINTGTTLIQLDNSKEKDNLVAAKTAAELSKLQFQRNKKLYKRHLIKQDDLYNSKVINQQKQATTVSDANDLANKTIVAPFSGYVGAKTISVGDYIQAGSKLVKLVDTRLLRIDYSLPSRYLSQLHLGQGVTVTSNVFPSTSFVAQVSYIAPTVDSISQTIEVHALLNNKNNLLKPGQFVKIQQQVGAIQKALLAPTQSVIASLNNYYVFTVKNNKAVKVPVKLGRRFAETIEVTSGLKADEKIVVAGQNQLKSGSKVKIKN